MIGMALQSSKGAGSFELLQYKIIKLAALVGDISPAKLVSP